MNIEPLEARVAPAAVFTYTDVDGDNVTITTSKGTNAQLAAALTLQDAGIGQELQLIDFSVEAAAFAGANLTVKSKRTELGGDGLVNVGAIDATDANGGGALDLGLVVIRGDLGQVDAGDSALGTPGVKGLTVNSMGQFGLTTQGVGGGFFSNVVGPLGFLKMTGNMIDARIECRSCGPVTIGGSLIGGDGISSGSIHSLSSIGPVKIGGNIAGGAGISSGAIRADTTVTSISLGGSLLGGEASGSGVIVAFHGIASVKVVGSVVGGDDTTSGAIGSDAGNIGKLTIGGSLLGGSGERSGFITSDGAIGPVKIGGSIVGDGVESGRIVAVTTIGAITVGGSLIGGGGDDSGSIVAPDSIGTVKIGGSVHGNGGSHSGKVSTLGPLGAVTIGGSILGGAGQSSGSVSGLGSMGAVKIGGDVAGGSASGAGAVTSNGSMASVTIGGSIYGGSADFTGYVLTAGSLGPVKISGSLVGGDVNAVDEVGTTGSIRGSHIASVFIGGSIISGTEAGGGTLTDSGSIRAANDIGPIVVKGSLIGNPANPVLITARGSATPLPGKDVAIRSLNVGGQVLYANILAGYGSATLVQALNANAQIGPVIVGDWIASNLVAGVQDDDDPQLDDPFGDGDDQLVSGGTGTIARIASVLIRGTALGSMMIIGDHFGFVAQQIGSFKIGSTVIPLTSGPGNDVDGLVIGITGDLRIREVAA